VEQALDPGRRVTVDDLTPSATGIRKSRNQTVRLARVAEPESQHAGLVAELTQAVCARDAFIAIAAHELRTGQFSIFLPSRARTRARAETKTRRVWRSAAAVSEMEFRNLQVM
jgi:hypothetical protein